MFDFIQFINLYFSKHEVESFEMNTFSIIFPYYLLDFFKPLNNILFIFVDIIIMTFFIKRGWYYD